MGSQFNFLLEYIEYLMYFFHCQETRRLVSIFKYIDAMDSADRGRSIIRVTSAEELALPPCCLLQVECKRGPERTISGSNKYTFILIFMIQIAIDSPIFKRFKKK
jgi:hypothetical protein